VSERKRLKVADIKLDQAFDGLVAGLKIKMLLVRRAVVEALANIKTHDAYKVNRCGR